MRLDRLLVALGIGLGAAGLAYLLVRPRRLLPVDSSDAEWLARVLVLEAGDIGPGDEWAGIMNVAWNRAKQVGGTVRQVVETTSWPGGGDRGRAFVEAIGQPGGVGYRSAYGHPAPPDHRRFPAALAFAQQVLSLAYPNPIGDRRHFVHPGGMPRCPCASNRTCRDGRCLPFWAVARSDGGTAEYEPVRVGRAIFA